MRQAHGDGWQFRGPYSAASRPPPLCRASRPSRARHAAGPRIKGARHIYVAERSKPPPKNGDVASPALKVASETLLSAAKRDYALIRYQLTKVSQVTIRESDPSLDSLADIPHHCFHFHE